MEAHAGRDLHQHNYIVACNWIPQSANIPYHSYDAASNALAVADEAHTKDSGHHRVSLWLHVRKISSDCTRLFWSAS